MSNVKTIHGEPFDQGPDAGMPEEFVMEIKRIMGKTGAQCKMALVITVSFDHVHASMMHGDNTTIQHARNMLAEIELQKQEVMTLFPRTSPAPLHPDGDDEEEA